MFKLQSPITTNNRTEERARRRTFIEARTAAGDTPEQAFTAWHHQQVAEDTDEDMIATRRSSHLITKLALFSSLFHQMGFFLAAASSLFGLNSHFSSGNPMEWIHPLSVLTGSVLIPIVIDLSILNTVRNLSMKVASFWSRISNIAGMLLFVSASSVINFNAPAPDELFNYGFGGVVLAIPVVMGLRAFFNPNFGQLDKDKKKAFAQVATATAKRCPAGCKCGKHKARKTTATRKPARKTTKPADPMADILDQAAEIKTTTETAAQNA